MAAANVDAPGSQRPCGAARPPPRTGPRTPPGWPSAPRPRLRHRDGRHVGVQVEARAVLQPDQGVHQGALDEGEEVGQGHRAARSGPDHRQGVSGVAAAPIQPRPHRPLAPEALDEQLVALEQRGALGPVHLCGGVAEPAEAPRRQVAGVHVGHPTGPRGVVEQARLAAQRPVGHHARIDLRDLPKGTEPRRIRSTRRRLPAARGRPSARPAARAARRDRAHGAAGREGLPPGARHHTRTRTPGKERRGRRSVTAWVASHRRRRRRVGLAQQRGGQDEGEPAADPGRSTATSARAPRGRSGGQATYQRRRAARSALSWCSGRRRAGCRPPRPSAPAGRSAPAAGPGPRDGHLRHRQGRRVHVATPQVGEAGLGAGHQEGARAWAGSCALRSGPWAAARAPATTCRASSGGVSQAPRRRRPARSAAGMGAPAGTRATALAWSGPTTCRVSVRPRSRGAAWRAHRARAPAADVTAQGSPDAASTDAAAAVDAATASPEDAAVFSQARRPDARACGVLRAGTRPCPPAS